MVYQEDEDSIDESDHGVLETKEEPENVTNNISYEKTYNTVSSNDFNRIT
jgi:hypothetical protein